MISFTFKGADFKIWARVLRTATLLIKCTFKITIKNEKKNVEKDKKDKMHFMLGNKLPGKWHDFECFKKLSLSKFFFQYFFSEANKKTIKKVGIPQRHALFQRSAYNCFLLPLSLSLSHSIFHTHTHTHTHINQ
jgi:hypothetical protein